MPVEILPRAESTTARRRYELVLIDQGEKDCPPPAVRLRRLLKNLLRTWGFRCVSAHELPAAALGETPTMEQDARGGQTP